MIVYIFFFQAEDGIRDSSVTGVQTCALPISTAPDQARRPVAKVLRGSYKRADDACMTPLSTGLAGLWKTLRRVVRSDLTHSDLTQSDFTQTDGPLPRNPHHPQP